MKRLLSLLLLVGLSLLGVPQLYAGQSNFGGVTIDAASDASTTSTTKVFRINNTAGSESYSITAAGAIVALTSTVTTSTVTTLTATTATITTAAITTLTADTIVVPTAPQADNQYLKIQNQYLVLYAFRASNRPASGAPAGAVVAINNANSAADCGAGGGGSVFVVCVSDGTNWKSLKNSQAV